MASPGEDPGTSPDSQQSLARNGQPDVARLEQGESATPLELPIRPWDLAPELPLADLDAGGPDLSRLQVQLLANRGVRGLAAAQAFLGASWHAAPPSLLGLDRAVARLRRAAADRERVAVFGDYDVDGLTSCATLLLALRAAGIQAAARLPARTDEGRGPSVAAVRELAEQGYTLLATTDCGTTNIAAIQQANKLDMEVIITDHHVPQGELAPALAVLNPQQPGCPSPEKHLTGVGVAFRLAEALLVAMAPERAEKTLAALLDLVAIGTIGDVAPMTGENWALVHAGLRQLNLQPRLGLRKLIAATKLEPGAISERDVSFVLAPHLNAAGRMGDPDVALRLLTTSDVDEAEQLAARLRQLNEARQRVTEEIVFQAHEQAREQTARGDALLAVAGEGWPLGVIGLVASRLAEEFARPVAVVSLGESDCRGSLRGPDGLHLAEALGQRAALLRHFGGHARAAGFTVARGDLAELLAHLRAAAHAHQTARRAHTAQPVEPQLPDVVEVAEAEDIAGALDAPAEPVGDVAWVGNPAGRGEARALLRIDCRLPLRRVSRETYTALRKLAPFGLEFTEPVFMAPRVRLERAWRSGPEGRTLRLALRDERDGQRRTAIWSRHGELQPLLRGLSLVDVAFTLDIDARPGAIQGYLMRVVGVRPAHIPA